MAMRSFKINGMAYRAVGTAEAAAKSAAEKGETIETPLADIYTDVGADAWYRFYIQGAMDKGVIPSFMVENNTISPDKTITREEAAAVIKACADYAKAEFKTTRMIPSFDDYDKVNADAKDAVDFVVNAGIMNGMNENEFEPTGSLTRAQAAAIIARTVR